MIYGLLIAYHSVGLIMFVATMAEEDCREDFMSFTLFQKVFYFGIFLFGWPLLMIVE